MKSKLILVFVLAIILFSNISSFAQTEEYDFRKVRWGMSKEEVKNSEVFTVDSEGEAYIYYSNIPNVLSHMNVDLTYSFNEGKLDEATYFFSFDYPHTEAYVYDFEYLKSKLIEDYGEPKEHEILWLNEFYKDKEEYLGYALANGLVGYFTDWETITTIIELSLFKFDEDVSIMLSFSDKTYQE